MAREASMARPKINFKDEDVVTYGENEDALFTFTPGEKVLNFGDLTTNGDLANGVFAGADDVSVRNFGAVETSGDGAAGIFVQGDNARIENFGSVITHGDPSVDGEFFSEGILAQGDGYYIANHGTVHVEGLSTSSLIGFGADGVVINYGQVESLASGGVIAIGALGDRSQVINAGNVTIGDQTGGLFTLGEEGVVLNRGQIHVTGDESVGMSGVGNDHEISNFGLIEAHGDFSGGIDARGSFSLGLAGTDLEILNAGRISTDGDVSIGIALGASVLGFSRGADGTIVNRGVIETAGDGAAGVLMAGDGHHLTNSGHIVTDGGAFDSPMHGVLHAAGVLVSGDGVSIENTRTGVIESEDTDSAAVELNVLERDGFPAADMSSSLENFGLIKGAGVAVLGGAGQETVINHGTIVGDVVLGDGADTFVFGKGSTLDGHLLLGAGNDLVRVEDGSGTSRIEDFVAGAANPDDVIDVSAFFSSFDDLEAHSQQQGNNVVVALDHDDTLILENLQLNALNAGDFFFG
jgi:hypothetical protein